MTRLRAPVRSDSHNWDSRPLEYLLRWAGAGINKESPLKGVRVRVRHMTQCNLA